MHHLQQPVSTIAFFIAHLFHGKDERIPEFCTWCPRMANHSFCTLHSPNKHDQSGYDRGVRVFKQILKDDPSKLHVWWRATRRKNITESSIIINDEWMAAFENNLKETLGHDWISKMNDLSISFPIIARSTQQLGSIINSAMKDTDPNCGDPIYFSKKLNEFWVYHQADEKARRRRGITYIEVLDAMKEIGSTKQVATRLGISQRMVQIILKTKKIESCTE